MGNSGVVNNHDYITAVLQYLGGDANQYTFRALVTVYSYNVNDSSNNMVITGNWSRSGAINLNGVYNHDYVWYQDISFPRGGSAYSVGFTVTWSGVNYWGATLSASASATVDAAAPVGGPPNPPITVTNTSISSTDAHTYISAAGAENGYTADYCEFHLYRGAPAGQAGAAHIATIGGDSANPKVGYGGLPWSASGITLTRVTDYWTYGRTHNAAGWSGWNGPNYFKTLPEAPVIAPGYTASSITRDSAIITNLSATDNGGQALNNVRVQHNSSATDVGATLIDRGTWGDVTITGLAAGTTRYYRAACANGYMWSDYGPWKSFTTLTGVPSSPAAPTFSSVTDTGMTATWVAPAANGGTITGYRWEVSRTNDFGSLVASGTTAPDVLSVTRTGLIPGTRYWWRVRANATPSNSGYGVANQITSGIEPESGLRPYFAVGGVLKQCTPYLAVGGELKPVRIMWANGSTLQTE